MPRADEPRGANKKPRPQKPEAPKYKSPGRGGGDTKSDLPSSPRRAPRVTAASKDTKSAADRGRAKAFEKTPTHRAAVRDTYTEQAPARRRQIAAASKGSAGPSAAEVRSIHAEPSNCKWSTPKEQANNRRRPTRPAPATRRA